MRGPKCQCEHRAHFEPGSRTPKGNLTHPYGREFHAEDVVKVKTEYGGFYVCKACAQDCWDGEGIDK